MISLERAEFFLRPRSTSALMTRVRHLSQARVRHIRFPTRKVVAVAEVDVQEMPAGTQHPLDLTEEAVEVRVDV